MNRSIQIVESEGTIYVPTYRGVIDQDPIERAAGIRSDWARLFVPVTGRQYAYRPDLIILIDDEYATLEEWQREQDYDRWLRSIHQ